MQLAMVTAAEGYGELVAHFHADGTGLGEAQVMRIGRLPTADEAWLRCDKFQMRPIAFALGFRDGQRALVDPAGG